jgi:hypothetical protein
MGWIVSNRDLEDFSFDMTGQQALDLLNSDALARFREYHGDVPILVEGRVGLIERTNVEGKTGVNDYMHELKVVGAWGSIVGGALAGKHLEENLESLLQVVV